MTVRSRRLPSPRPRADGCTQISSISALAPPRAEMRMVVVATPRSPASAKNPRPGSERMASTFCSRCATTRPSWLKNAFRSLVTTSASAVVASLTGSCVTGPVESAIDPTVADRRDRQPLCAAHQILDRDILVDRVLPGDAAGPPADARGAAEPAEAGRVEPGIEPGQPRPLAGALAP